MNKTILILSLLTLSQAVFADTVTEKIQVAANPSINGVWVGKYSCQLTPTLVELQIKDNKQANFHFFNPDDTFIYFDGSFGGSININNEFVTFIPNSDKIDHWNLPPNNADFWKTLGFTVKLSKTGNEMVGNTTVQGCSVIKFKRVKTKG